MAEPVILGDPAMVEQNLFQGQTQADSITDSVIMEGLLQQPQSPGGAEMEAVQFVASGGEQAVLPSQFQGQSQQYCSISDSDIVHALSQQQQISGGVVDLGQDMGRLMH